MNTKNDREKKYEKPSMKVFELRQQQRLLVGSEGSGGINPMDNPELI